MPDKYVLVDQSDAVVSTGTFRELFPAVKPAANGPDADFLAANNAHLLHGVPSYDPATHYEVPVAPYLDGDIWRDVEIAAYTQAEIETRASIAFAKAKADKIKAVSAEFLGRRNAGVMVSGNLYATTNDGHQELKALKERLDRVGGTQKAVTRAGDKINVNAAQAAAIFTAVDDYIAACWTREYDLTVAIDAAADQAALDAIDVIAGWPE